MESRCSQLSNALLGIFFGSTENICAINVLSNGFAVESRFYGKVKSDLEIFKSKMTLDFTVFKLEFSTQMEISDNEIKHFIWKRRKISFQRTYRYHYRFHRKYLRHQCPQQRLRCRYLIFTGPPEVNVEKNGYFALRSLGTQEIVSEWCQMSKTMLRCSKTPAQLPTNIFRSQLQKW